MAAILILMLFISWSAVGKFHLQPIFYYRPRPVKSVRHHRPPARVQG